MRIQNRHRVLVVAAGLALIAALAAAQTQTGSSQSVVIPKNAAALEGMPTVRLDVVGDSAKRQELDLKHAAANALKIDIVDGRYYWTSRESRPLTLTTSGEFTYLTPPEPGQYIRFRKINDRLAYVEHVDMGLGSVTYWGELRIVAGK